MNELHRAEYDRIVKNTAIDAAKASLEEADFDDFDEAFDAAMWTNDAAQQAIKFQPLRVIEYAANIDHWDQLVDPAEDETDPEIALEAMARRGFEHDVYDVYDAIITVARSSEARASILGEDDIEADAN